MQVNFKTNILLKNIIGKDLITDDNIAVLELVKNAYDAGSPLVDLDFSNIIMDLFHSDEDVSSLTICDRGVGMDADGLINRWLNIAYSEKKEQNWMNGRRQAGNKGVGRFSCDRLGRYLKIYTKTENGPCLRLTIDWTVFEKEDAQDLEIQSIPLSMEEVSVQEVLDITGWEGFEHGTILQILNLREDWNTNKLLRLKRDLEKFINPNQTFQNQRFDITIKVPELLYQDEDQKNEADKINGPVNNKVFERLDFKTSSISSYIDEKGEYITTVLTDRGRVVFELKEKNIYPHLRNVRTHVYYLNTYTKRYFKLQTGFTSVDFGSIFLFVNGFRVPPYGDQGDDWLGIEKRKSLGFRRYLSTREVVGRIEITDEANDFKIITSRSGIVHNVAFEELSKEGAPYGFFYKAFRRLERFVVEGIKWDKVGDYVSKETQEDEVFMLDDFSRNKQIISVIRNIIDVGEESIIDLQINEELVKSILDRQMEETRNSLDTILDNLSDLTDNLDVEGIHRYKEKLSSDSKELEKLITIVNRLTPDSDKLKDIKSIQELIASKQESIDQLEVDLIEARHAREEAEAQAKRLERELELEKEKNTYLLTSSRSMSEDAKNMVHNIKIIATDIKSELDVLLDTVATDDYTQTNLLESFSLIKFLNDKLLKISKLITRANFKSESDEQIVDIPGYIRQYIDIYKDIVGKCSVNLHVGSQGAKFKRSMSILDLALMMDNIISNSQKANASNIWIDMQVKSLSELSIKISDDGGGLDSSLEYNPDKIFELGVTTTDGSGIGLYAVRSALRKIGCDIVYEGRRENGQGAVFNIIIRR